MFLQVLIEGIINGSIIALVAIGVSLIWGVMNILNFAQGEFLMIGMYVAFFMNKLFGWDPIATLPIAAIVLFIIGYLIYKSMISRVLKGPMLSQRLLTFGLSMVLLNLALMLFGGEYRTVPDLLFTGTTTIFGAKIIVIHPNQHLNYADHQRELFPMNVAFYKRLVPYAEKFGIKIATENMWQDNNGSRIPSDSVCSRAWEFNELIDAVDSPYLVGCLDIGHVSLMGADIPKFIHDMGAKRIQALHIHDTDFVNDSHTLPFLEKVDYVAVAKALGEIGNSGDLTFEIPYFFAKFPAELLLPAAKLACETGKYLAGILEEAKL